MRIEISPEASDDLQSIYAYLEPLNPIAARGLIARLRAAIFGLDISPRRGRVLADGARELLSVRPYVIVYDVGEESVTILRIWHGAQNRT